jgi:hypothetical protein
MKIKPFFKSMTTLFIHLFNVTKKMVAFDDLFFFVAFYPYNLMYLIKHYLSTESHKSGLKIRWINKITIMVRVQ